MNNILKFSDGINLNEIKHRKIISFDLDGTLAESKQSLSTDMGMLIGDLLKKTDVAVISGGSFEQFKKQFLPFLPFLSALPANLGSTATDIKTNHNLYILPVSGSQRYEFSSDWIMTDSVVFPAEQKTKVLAALKEFEEKYVTSDTETVAPEFAHDAVEYDLPKQTFGPRVEERGTQITFSALGQSAPVDLKKAWDPDINKRKKIASYLTEHLPEVEIHIGGSTSIDILPKGFDKAAGLERLFSTKGMSKEDMVFVGDAVFEGGNDFSPSTVGILTISIKDPSETAELIRQWIA